MDFVCVTSRFRFYDGIKRYTVEFTYGLSSWFVFEEDKHTDAIFVKKIRAQKQKSPNRESAEEILYEYLNQ